MEKHLEFPVHLFRPEGCNFNLNDYVSSLLDLNIQPPNMKNLITTNIEKYVKELNLLEEQKNCYIKIYKDIYQALNHEFIKNNQVLIDKFILEHISFCNKQFLFLQLSLRETFCASILEHAKIYGILPDSKTKYGNPKLEKLYESKNTEQVYLQLTEKLYMAAICNTSVHKVNEWMANKRHRVEMGSVPKKSIKRNQDYEDLYSSDSE
ncbi:hypothetical protein DLAC_02763 [Tieghemostelium lacteum]|uniref:Uncharacterized protein n=1 Tax=Tieghemostelium lacteum TaxID=361077 RepID=A0A152A388_TIELA|nr:hypothetical protein DLAC_02763 [Tieghemostelium lacteum]|eukprot:KYR00723.1 hypothetical protein DLAC_02763 [Tieghemostelium lacteum]